MATEEIVEFGVASNAKKFTLTPLSYGAMKRLDQSGATKLALSKGGDPTATMDALVACIHETVKRTHPEVTMDALLELLDRESGQRAIEAFLRVNGFKAVEPGEAQAR